MRILISNDDGIDAPGLRLLAQAARALDAEVWTVAPERKWTAASHRVSFDADIMLTRRDSRSFACSGTPADCVIAALAVIEGGLAPDLVLAGVNDKRNVGEDLAYSGTLAIAREATFWGVPAIAFARDAWPDDDGPDVPFVGRLLRLLWERRAQWHAQDSWLGVNLPCALPAPIMQATLARDKIAAAADVIEQGAASTVFRLRRGRPGAASPGDENALLRSGAVVLVRYAWSTAAALPETTLRDWNALLDQGLL